MAALRVLDIILVVQRYLRENKRERGYQVNSSMRISWVECNILLGFFHLVA